MRTQYYDGTKLLSLSDANGRRPEIYIVTSNRTAGKTTFFGRYFMRRFLNYQEKFILLYRFVYEIDNIPDKFFKDIRSLFFPDLTMSAAKKARGVYHEIYIHDAPTAPGQLCGYALALNNADQIKKYSHLFSDVYRILFDEFQSETNHYCPDEIRKFQSVHTSIARGQGQQTRYVPVFMLSNPVSIINPYYTALGISHRLRTDTKFLKGPGYVLEQGHNETAADALQQSGFFQAFSQETDYLQYAAQGVYLNDNIAFIEKPSGRSRYLATLIYNKKEYAIREYADAGLIYCDDRPDASYKYKIAITTDDHRINYVMLKNNDLFIMTMRQLFERGAFRFRDLKCKEVIMRMISY